MEALLLQQHQPTASQSFTQSKKRYENDQTKNKEYLPTPNFNNDEKEVTDALVDPLIKNNTENPLSGMYLVKIPLFGNFLMEI